jgi:LCP family protein required for cell wall assembly
MSYDDPVALDRLRAFDRRDQQADEGSPVGQFLLSIVLPGLASLRRAPLIAILCFLSGVALPFVLAAWVFSRRADIIGVALDPTFLRIVTIVGLLFVLSRLAAVGEVAYAHRTRRGIGGWTTLATAIVLVLAVPVLWATYRANDARSVFGTVFAGSDGPALFTPVDPQAAGVTNVLLLGGDAGPGRWGMRTDTMILVSVDQASGRTSLISIPRNLTRLRFPPGTPLAEAFPDGFDDLANAVFTYVNTRPELVTYYGASGLQPEAVALAGAIGYSLDVVIDDYALVNMKGFANVIDAVGGVTLELADAVPLPPSPADERPVPASIGPGLVEMDGAIAIAYARSRSADSDYQRMGRQRQLLAALGSQVSASEALSAFGSVTGALDDSMRTSLSPGEFTDLLDRLGDNSAIVESVGLVPPLVTPGDPDYPQIQAIADAVENAIVTGVPSGYSG